jgi:hypothetical protein
VTHLFFAHHVTARPGEDSGFFGHFDRFGAHLGPVLEDSCRGLVPGFGPDLVAQAMCIGG